jgi:hypothetical protein
LLEVTLPGWDLVTVSIRCVTSAPCCSRPAKPFLRAPFQGGARRNALWRVRGFFLGVLGVSFIFLRWITTRRHGQFGATGTLALWLTWPLHTQLWEQMRAAPRNASVRVGWNGCSFLGRHELLQGMRVSVGRMARMLLVEVWLRCGAPMACWSPRSTQRPPSSALRKAKP